MLLFRIVADLTILNLATAGAGFWETLFLDLRISSPDENHSVNNAVSCYKESVQFSASFVKSLFASF